MNTRKQFAGAALALLLIAVGSYGWHRYQTRQATVIQLAGFGVETLPYFEFPDLEGRLRQSDEWRGKLLVINFWATWCPPCREEMPLFIRTQGKYAQNGVQFIGIAIDDEDLVRDFNDVYQINFPTLIGGPDGIKLANTLGNRFDSLPFTAIIDQQGKSRYVQAGEMSERTLMEQIQPLLK